MTDNVAGLLCYILGLITGILFLVLEPYNRNPFVRFHAFQSVFYGVSAIGLMIVLAILGIIVTSILPFGLAMLWHMLTMLIWLGYFVGWIILMVKAYGGQRFKLPLIGDLAEKQAAK